MKICFKFTCVRLGTLGTHYSCQKQGGAATGCPLNNGQKAHVHLSSYLTTQEDERDREREAEMKER
jgi:hypothetical protein